MPTPLALRLHKIRYTYKLREYLLGQVGYYSGSLELAADMDDEFEYQMCIIQMKLRRPDRLHVFKAPKAMAHYTTDPTSLLPWNNQLSFSYAYDEFGPQQMPIFGTNYIERKLVEVLRLDEDGKKWNALCEVLNWEKADLTLVAELYRIKTEFVSAEKAGEAPSFFLHIVVTGLMTFTERTGLTSAARHFLGGNLTLFDCGFRSLTLPNIMLHMQDDETQRKDFYTLVLGVTWSDTPFRKEENPFAKEYEKRSRGNPIAYDLAHLESSDVKDPRIAGNRPALTLRLAKYYPHMVGRKANYVPTPETAGAKYRLKLQRLSEAELDRLFSNIAAYPHGASLADKLDSVVDQAVKAARGVHGCLPRIDIRRCHA